MRQNYKKNLIRIHPDKKCDKNKYPLHVLQADYYCFFKYVPERKLFYKPVRMTDILIKKLKYSCCDSYFIEQIPVCPIASLHWFEHYFLFQSMTKDNGNEIVSLKDTK
jgi:hypothetical protein